MSIEDVLVTAVKPLVPELAPGSYEGAATTYGVYLYDLLPRAHAGGGRPHAIVALAALHLFMPLGINSRELRREICEALFAAGCTYPSIEDETDDKQQHFVFEFEHKEG